MNGTRASSTGTPAIAATLLIFLVGNVVAFDGSLQPARQPGNPAIAKYAFCTILLLEEGWIIGWWEKTVHDRLASINTSEVTEFQPM